MTTPLIRSRDGAKQLIDFSGIKMFGCYPTDLDLTLEYRGNVFVFVEIKRHGTNITIGQRLYLEHVCDAIEAGGKRCLCAFATHQSDGDIDAASCIAMSYYSSGEWKDCGGITLKKLLEWFEETTRPPLRIH